MILVTGATGTIGRALVERLDRRDVAFRAASRNREHEHEHAATNLVAMDFAEPASIAAAMRDVDVVFLNSSQHPDMVELQGNVVDAARRAGVRHIVKVSGGNAFTGPDKPTWVGRAHAQVEAGIVESGMGWTFLRPRYFTQNLLVLAARISGGTLPVPLTHQRLAPVDTRDIAEAAAVILTSPSKHDGRVYDLSGPESLTFDEIADRLSGVLGRKVTHVAPPLEAVVAGLADAGVPEWLRRNLAEGMTIFANDPSVAGVSADIERITGRPAAPVDRFIVDHKAAFEQ